MVRAVSLWVAALETGRRLLKSAMGGHRRYYSKVSDTQVQLTWASTLLFKACVKLPELFYLRKSFYTVFESVVTSHEEKLKLSS